MTFASAATAAEIPKPPDVGRIKSDVYKMRSGTIRVKDPDSPAQAKKNLENIKAVAQWLAFTIATPPYNGEPVPREDKTPAFISRTMGDLMGEADSLCQLPIGAGTSGRPIPEQVEYGVEFGAAVADAAKVVLANSARPIERVNAVRLMSIAARLPAPALAEPLIEIAGNPKISDAEKLYAFQGLRNLLDQSDLIDPTRHVVRDVAVLAKIATTLSAYITQNRGPRDDREKAVIEFVRRHAIAAVAQFKDGAIRKPNKDLLARPSWTLARVLEQDPTVSPPFTIQEQAEAGIGFAQMRIDPDMNLDVAAYTMAKLMVLFARAANLDVERATRDGTLPAAHWKVLAARLSYALATWRESCKSLPKTRHPDAVVSLADAGIALLTQIEKDGGGARTGTEIARVTTWAQNNAPKAWSENPPKPAQLYSDDPQSLLPFAVPAKKGSESSPMLKTPGTPVKK